jgi:hypothetical protein
MRRERYGGAPNQFFTIGTPNVASFAMSIPKVLRCVTAAMFVFSASVSLHAESPFIRELTQLQQQRDKALQSATEPIQRSYRQGLEALARRATQAGDLEAAELLRKELEKLGGPEAAESLASPTVSAGADAIAKHLIGTKWTYFGKETLTFLADGKAEWSTGKQIWPWKVVSVGRRTIEVVNMAKGVKFTIAFEHDFKTGNIEGDGGPRKAYLVP